ncbi:MAG: hypothetical protein KJ607_14030, partial [Bacteroidetes bacterium]|nr:hypothetical protein [Bacteroidota bacterium]
MKKLFSLTLLLTGLCITRLTAQQIVWTHHFTGTGTNDPVASAYDDSNNLYVVGNFSGSVSIDGNNLTSYGGSVDVFLLKISASGSFEWIEQIGSDLADEAEGIIVTGDGTVLICGAFKDTCDFGGTTLISYGGFDAFLAKYNTSGTLQWTKRIAWGPDDDRTRDIGNENDNYFLVSGYYRDSAYFGLTAYHPANDTLFWNTFTNNFAAKYDTDGNFIWVQNYPGTQNITKINCVDYSKNGYYATGLYRNDFTIGATTLTADGALPDVFLFRMDTSGAVEWIREIHGADAESNYSLSVDTAGNVYCNGFVSSAAAEFDSTDVETSAIAYTFLGSQDYFVAKYDSAGTLQWYDVKGGA